MAAPTAGSDRPLGVGVCGLSRAFVLMRPGFAAEPRVALVAAADPRPEARAAFAADHGATYHDLAAMLADPAVEAVYVATPHGLHAEHAIAAARAGKAVLVEKPMAPSLAECRAMAQAAEAAGVALVVGPSHSYDAPVVKAAELIASGAQGRVRMVTALACTDFLLRPRTPEELDPERGGGVVLSQAAHQVDVVRRLVGASCLRVRAHVSGWEAGRPEGAYQALLAFDGGAHASLTYSGHARYDSDALMGGVGEMGAAKDPGRHAATRGALALGDEAARKRGRAYSAPLGPAPTPPFHEHLGFVLVSCERADLRLTPTGVEVHGDGGCEIMDVPRERPAGAAALAELWEGAVLGRPPLHDGRWGAETLAVCLAIRRSAVEDREIAVEAFDL